MCSLAVCFFFSSCRRGYSFACVVVHVCTATIEMAGDERLYNKVNTDYIDPGANAMITRSDGTLQEQASVPVLNTVPYPCEIAGEYTVEYEFSWPGCQCCSCQLNELSKDRSVTAQRIVIVCTYNILKHTYRKLVTHVSDSCHILLYCPFRPSGIDLAHRWRSGAAPARHALR